MIDFLIFFFSVILVNVVLAFILPTWMVISFFSIFYEIPIFYAVIFGVIGSSIGRLILAKYTSLAADKFLPKKQKKSVKTLKRFLTYERGKLPFIISFIYSLGPLPSNLLFIFSGAVHLDLKSIISGFFVGRLISYSVLVNFVKGILSITELFSPMNLIFDGICGVLGILILFVNWNDIIKKIIEKEQRRREEIGFRKTFV